MKTPHEFYLEWIGRGADPDHHYGFQCVDLFNQFCIEAGYSYPLVRGAVDFKEAWIQNLGNLQAGFASVSADDIKDGDWLFWGYPHGILDGEVFGHVAMARKRNPDGSWIVLGQNQGGPNGTANQISLSLYGLVLVLRPRCYMGGYAPAAPAPSAGVCDQILTVNSKVKFQAFVIGAIDPAQDWVHSSALGGWVSAGPVEEVDAADGAKDQILHVGSRGTIPGTYTVDAINADTDQAHIKELGFWVRAGVLDEVEEGY